MYYVLCIMDYGLWIMYYGLLLEVIQFPMITGFVLPFNEMHYDFDVLCTFGVDVLASTSGKLWIQVWACLVP